MERMIRRGGLFVLIAVFGLTMVLGGCSAEKKKAEAAQAEAAELREKNASLEQANRDTAARLAEAEAKLNQGGGGVDDNNPVPANNNGGPTKAHHNGGNGQMITRNKETGLLGVTLGGDVLFGSGSDNIKPEAKKMLDKIASEIKTQYGGASIRVEGYTDSDPIKKSKWGSNEHLSQARADAVRKYLISKGIKAGHIEAMGYGAAKPKASKAESRRVEIVVIQ
jgi:outer membrane protein OmpA-like peptidoglycan-associated protein